jgi:hypothetical protein
MPHAQGAQDGTDMEELACLAGKTLLAKYTKEAPSKVALIAATLKAQGFQA